MSHLEKQTTVPNESSNMFSVEIKKELEDLKQMVKTIQRPANGMFISSMK